MIVITSVSSLQIIHLNRSHPQKVFKKQSVTVKISMLEPAVLLTEGYTVKRLKEKKNG